VVNEAAAARVLRVFELYAETGSPMPVLRQLCAGVVTVRSGRALNKGDIHKIRRLWTYVGEVAHKGSIYPGEHQAIVPRQLWDRVHAKMQDSPRSGANGNRQQTGALLQGLLYGIDGRALSPSHSRMAAGCIATTWRRGVLKGDEVAGETIVRRISAAEIEGAVIDQLRVPAPAGRGAAWQHQRDGAGRATGAWTSRHAAAADAARANDRSIHSRWPTAGGGDAAAIAGAVSRSLD
jgi:hypothetical protein